VNGEVFCNVNFALYSTMFCVRWNEIWPPKKSHHSKHLLCHSSLWTLYFYRRIRDDYLTSLTLYYSCSLCVRLRVFREDKHNLYQVFA
jgi:hypothetical protein